MTRRFVLMGLSGLGALAAERGGQLSPEELSKLLEKRENLFFLDVREPSEIQQLGSLPGYVNIPLEQLERRLSEEQADYHGLNARIQVRACRGHTQKERIQGSGLLRARRLQEEGRQGGLP